MKNQEYDEPVWDSAGVQSTVVSTEAPSILSLRGQMPQDTQVKTPKDCQMDVQCQLSPRQRILS